MVTLEQIKLLETKIARAIDIVVRVTGENARLKSKLENYQKRIGELEVLIQRFKEDQSRIEDGILSALNRLNEFETALESSFAPAKSAESSIPEKILVPEAKSPRPEDKETGNTLIFSVSEDKVSKADEEAEKDDDFENGDSENNGVSEGGNDSYGDDTAENDDRNSGNSGDGTVELDIF
jgi:predicted nuclease with TOPRIM domain